MEAIKTKLRNTPFKDQIKAAHIWTAYDKAAQVRKKLNHIFGSQLRTNLPLGKKLRFVPHALDSRFIISDKQRFNISKLKSAQKAFMNSVVTAVSYSIIGLDYHHPTYDVTLRESIMALRSTTQPHQNLFISVDTMGFTEDVIFSFKKEFQEEALTAIPALPLILEQQRQLGNKAVSYTHLTLPTICSV